MDELLTAAKWIIIITALNVNIIYLLKFLLGEPLSPGGITKLKERLKRSKK